MVRLQYMSAHATRKLTISISRSPSFAISHENALVFWILAAARQRARSTFQVDVNRYFYGTRQRAYEIASRDVTPVIAESLSSQKIYWHNCRALLSTSS